MIFNKSKQNFPASGVKHRMTGQVTTTPHIYKIKHLFGGAFLSLCARCEALAADSPEEVWTTKKCKTEQQVSMGR